MNQLLPPEGMDGLTTKTDIQLLDGRISGLETKVTALDVKVTGLDLRMVRLATRMDGLDERMGRFEKYMDTFDGRVHGFHEALREQTRTFAIASSTSTLLVAGVAFAAARLVQ